MKVRMGTRASARWAALRRMVLKRADGVVYLDRIRLVQTPWFGVYLHRFDGPDPGGHLHDHPWPFATIVVSGGYTEERADTRSGTEPEAWHVENRQRFRPRVMRLTECHTITGLDKVGTRSIVVVGRRTRTWGFYTPEGWVRWDLYNDQHRPLTYASDDGRP